MDKLTTPSPPPVLTKRQHSGRNTLRLSTNPDPSLVGDGSPHDVTGTSDRSPEKDGTFGSTPLSSPTAQSSSLKNDTSSSSTATEHRIDRSVESRNQFQITLPLPGSCSNMSNTIGSDTEAPVDQRGWSSPHGEPYRPLGKPDLNLKFSPRLANGSNLLQNAHRMKVFEGKDDKEKGGSEVRHANAVGTAHGASSPALQAARPGLFEMFPLNFANKKRPLDERQVKLAHRLHASVSHYSPEKMRGLRRNNVQQRELMLLDATEPHSFQAGAGGTAAGTDTSVDLLRHAIHECSSRLRSVKNGAGFLAQVPSSEHLELLVLQEKYHRERAQYALSAPNPHHSHASGATTRATGTRGLLRTASIQHHTDDDDPLDASSRWDFDTSSNAMATTASGGGGVENDDLYLPYTTRRLQKSPNKRHPTLSEFKSRVREEKMPRPLLSIQSSTPSENSPAPSSALSTTRSSTHAGQSILLSGYRALDIAESSYSTVGTPASPSPPRASRTTSLSSSPQVPNEWTQIGSGPNELTSLSLRTGKHSKPKSQGQQQKKLHSVERLQAAVDAIQDAKRTHSELLAKTVESLNQDRRDCLAVKFRHFNVQRHLDDDIYQMRHASEAHRVETIDDTIDRSADWYRDLLRQLLTREAPLHPAESFFVRAIRQISNEGHEFEKGLFFRLILLLHRDDLYILEVQQMLTFLRQALEISLEEWELFFNANALPEPAEIYERKEIKQEKKQHRLAKLRAVVTLNQAIRHFSRSDKRSR